MFSVTFCLVIVKVSATTFFGLKVSAIGIRTFIIRIKRIIDDC